MVNGNMINGFSVFQWPLCIIGIRIIVYRLPLFVSYMRK